MAVGVFYDETRQNGVIPKREEPRIGQPGTGRRTRRKAGRPAVMRPPVYRCTPCGQNFETEALIAKHNRETHPKLTISCPKCFNVYRWASLKKGHRCTNM